jgi:hypothetical protein
MSEVCWSISAQPDFLVFSLLLAVEDSMARDRNVTVWQAYVYVMSIVSFLCLGTMVYMWFTSGTNQKTAENALKEKQNAEQNLRKASQTNQLLQNMLGVGKPLSEQEVSTLKSSIQGDAEMETALKTHENHMSLFGQSASEKSYIKLVDTLMRELRDRNVAIAKLESKATDQDQKHKQTIDQETKAREQAQKEKESINLEAQKRLAEYTAKEDELGKRIEQLKAEKEQQARAYNAEKKALNDKLAAATNLNNEQKKRLDSAVRRLEEAQNENFQYTQGKITEVIDGFVWIDIGREKGIRPGVTFAVYDADVSQVAQAKAKAKIEVVDVIAGTENLSRCKILDDRAFTAILRGDKVYSPLWQPGAAVQIALFGKMDIDGDGKDDREKLKNLIQQNGGEVVMDAGPTKVEGGLTEQVRWLVIGEELKIRTDAEGNRDPESMAKAQQRADIETQAKSLGITKINLNKLMSWLQANQDSSLLGEIGSSNIRDYRSPSTQRSGGRVSSLFQGPDGKPPSPRAKTD